MMIDRKEPEEDPNTRMIAPVLEEESNKPSALCQMKYHVTDSKQFLASVEKMNQAGNRVVFDEDGSYIKSKKTGENMSMISENGVYKLDVIFINGDDAERGK